MTDKKKRVMGTGIVYAIMLATLFAITTKETGWDAWLTNLLAASGATLLVALFCGELIRRPPTVEDAPPHDHGHRLYYAGGMNGWEVICPRCGKRWKLHEDDAFFIRGAVYALWLLIVLAGVFLPAVSDVPAIPAPYDKLAWAVGCVPAALIVHPIAGLLLRGKDLSGRIIEEEESGPEA